MLQGIIKRWKRVMLLCILIFSVSVLIGIVAGFLGDYSTFRPKEAEMLDIFVNNTKICIFIIVSGLLTGGVLSSIVLIINGYIIGIVIYGAIADYGFLPILTGLMPHFFIELAAIVSCATVGFMSSISFLMCIGKWSKLPLPRLIKDGTILILIAILLLLFASWVESNISKVVL
ncbi:stage II sporulation protein M [Geobacillus vulcani]|uniref:stage II sporulation protein M n=1 Tax=Geobacillus vulcani TaxID=135517 RepID=UPI00068EA5A9|nr:stage II sporulation protein M [Geobacillus vulcani]